MAPAAPPPAHRRASFCSCPHELRGVPWHVRSLHPLPRSSRGVDEPRRGRGRAPRHAGFSLPYSRTFALSHFFPLDKPLQTPYSGLTNGRFRAVSVQQHRLTFTETRGDLHGAVHTK